MISYAGERFDFVIETHQNVDNYWIRLRGLMDCDERFTKAHQVAILRYEGAAKKDPKGVVAYERESNDSMGQVCLCATCSNFSIYHIPTFIRM